MATIYGSYYSLFFFFIDLKDSRGRLNDKTVKSTSVFIIAIT